MCIVASNYYQLIRRIQSSTTAQFPKDTPPLLLTTSFYLDTPRRILPNSYTASPHITTFTYGQLFPSVYAISKAPNSANPPSIANSSTCIPSVSSPSILPNDAVFKQPSNTTEGCCLILSVCALCFVVARWSNCWRTRMSLVISECLHVLLIFQEGQCRTISPPSHINEQG